jgi:hypothetical protein
MIAIAGSLCLLAGAVNAQAIKTCAGVDVRSVEVSADPDVSQNRSKSIFLPRGPSPSIDILTPAAPKPGVENTTPQYVTILARGPVLGSMDSQKIETDFSCTANGVLLTAIITRSENYTGAVLKNAAWRPQLRALLMLHQSNVALETIWKMRLSNGNDVTNAETPAYATQQYPIVVTRTVRLPSSGQK